MTWNRFAGSRSKPIIAPIPVSPPPRNTTRCFFPGSPAIAPGTLPGEAGFAGADFAATTFPCCVCFFCRSASAGASAVSVARNGVSSASSMRWSSPGAGSSDDAAAAHVSISAVAAARKAAVTGSP